MIPRQCAVMLAETGVTATVALSSFGNNPERGKKDWANYIRMPYKGRI